MRRHLALLSLLLLPAFLATGSGCASGPAASEAPAAPSAVPSVASAPPSVVPGSGAASAPPSAAAGPTLPEATPEVPLDAGHPLLVFVDGVPQKPAAVDAGELRRGGYTVINLRNDWTPYIFAEFKDPEGNVLPNRYRRIYMGLANNRTDGDGRDIKPDRHNYLELFGIPPSIGVLRERTLADEERSCHNHVDYALLRGIENIPQRKPKEQAAYAAGMGRLRKRLDEARKTAGAESFAALVAAQPDWKDELEALDTYERRAQAMPEIVKRLKCDAHLKESARFKPTVEDPVFKDAVLGFQMRHMIYEYPSLRPGTMKALARTPREGNYEAFVRALRERIADGAGVLEDGTATVDGQPATYKNAAGETVPVRNLVEELTLAALKQMGLESPDALLAFFRAHPAQDFEWLQVAVRLPSLPEYYGDAMDLDIVIDRGDVWYAPTWDEKGVLRYPSRERMPKLTLYATVGEQRFPLVRWPTTIGGWRAEQAANGYEYYRYKGSDVGRRVIRKIYSGPTWVAPPTTPIRGLIKGADVNGHRERIVNYDEMGPGFLSAYGLVAGYFVVPGLDGRPDGDNGIRAHGSSDYMSITNPGKFSHGCHRLMNHLAVRLYDFILNHRQKDVLGDQRLSGTRQFFRDGHVYELRLPTRGFAFQLTPPVPVNVLEGRIRGPVRHPIEGYVPKPDIVYPPGPIPSPKGGGATP